MATITTAMIKDLRERSGAGMMDCKQALDENSGDIDAAVDWLRKKGLSKAAKKSGRIAAEGLIGVIVEGSRGAAVEVNSETDFVARNDKFQDMVRKITSLAPAAGGDLAKLLAATYPGTGKTVEAFVQEAIATIGENMGVRRTATIDVSGGVVADYLHNRIAPGCGKIGVLVALESTGDKAKLIEFGRQIAMHIAATNPMVVSQDQLSQDVIDRERAIYVEQARAEPRNAGKSDEILAKASEGRLRKEFFGNVVLMLQVFVVDGKATVAEAVKAAEKSVGAPIRIAGFIRYALGEGIERKEEDFAAEVAKAVKGG
jgi:elongation factor Ts